MCKDIKQPGDSSINTNRNNMNRSRIIHNKIAFTFAITMKCFWTVYADLISNQHDDNVGLRVVSQLFEPTLHILKSNMFWYIINKKCTNRTSASDGISNEPQARKRKRLMTSGRTRRVVTNKDRVTNTDRHNTQLWLYFTCSMHLWWLGSVLDRPYPIFVLYPDWKVSKKSMALVHKTM